MENIHDNGENGGIFGSQDHAFLAMGRNKYIRRDTLRFKSDEMLAGAY